MPGHDEYGKQVLWHASNKRVRLDGAEVEIDYGAGGRCRIDGALDGSIAIEVEARTSKQVRGAVLDLICHPFPKKLLILIPANMDVRHEKPRCGAILSRFFAQDHFSVVALNGTGDRPDMATDVAVVSAAINQLSRASP